MWELPTFGDLSQSPSFLTEIDDQPDPTPLSAAYSFLDTKNEIRSTCANVGPADRQVILYSVLTRSGKTHKTSEPLHSSCTRTVSSLVGSERYAGFPKM